MEKLRFEIGDSPKEKEEQRRRDEEEFRRTRDFCEGRIPFEYRYEFPEGGELIATTDQNSIGHIGILNKGKVFDFASLLPNGYRFVTPDYFKKHPEEETLMDYFGGTWATRNKGQVVLLGEFETPRDLLIFLHEIGHARGDTSEEIKLHEKLDRDLWDETMKKEIDKDKDTYYRSIDKGWERIKSEMEVLLTEDLAKTLSSAERRAWANAVRMLRQVQKETGVDMKAIFPNFESVKKYIDRCLGSYRRSYEWIIKGGYDPDFYKELGQLFDKWQYVKSSESEKSKEMKFIEGHPICRECLNASHGHSIEPGERHDCKNTGKISGKTYQCHCGFGGVVQDGEWHSWEEK